MDKLGQITIDNSLSVAVNCQVDQNLLSKNFINIINALKELQQAQLKSQAQINDLNSLKSKVDQLNQKIQSQSQINSNKLDDKNRKNEEKNTESNSQTNLSAILLDLGALAKRVQRNEQNTQGNTKDINLINKELNLLRSDVDDLKNQKNNSNINKKINESPGYSIADIGQNLSKQLQQNASQISDIHSKLKKMESQIEKLNEKLKQFAIKNKAKDQVSTQHISNNSQKDLQGLRDDLKDKLDTINKKINNIQSGQNELEKQVAQIRQMLDDENKNAESTQNKAQNKAQNNSQKFDQYKKEISDLRKKIDQLDKRQAKDIKILQEQLKKLKALLENRLEDQNARSRRKSTINNNDDLSDRVFQLEKKIEKLLIGSKNSFLDDKNPEKLPAINRPKRKDPNLTVFGGQKQKSGITRKDIGQLRSELEIWVKGLFDQNKQKQNFERLQLKMEELKRALQKKADAEGTKKGFNFLQNKITQLYLFLTEPETEDAMIVRKGFNCLSCSKKVEKLRGKLGPRLNWNNMTSTNYSPPRVGYSKPMGQNSGDKQDYQ